MKNRGLIYKTLRNINILQDEEEELLFAASANERKIWAKASPKYTRPFINKQKQNKQTDAVKQRPLTEKENKIQRVRGYRTEQIRYEKNRNESRETRLRIEEFQITVYRPSGASEAPRNDEEDDDRDVLDRDPRRNQDSSSRPTVEVDVCSGKVITKYFKIRNFNI